MLKGFCLYIGTIQHLAICQLLSRLASPIKRGILIRLKRAQAAVVPSERLRPQESWLCHDAWNTSGALGEGRFAFLGQVANLGYPVNWKATRRSLLWRFWLHSFAYLLLLPTEERIKFCQEWIAGNPLGSQPAWHSHPLSRRIVNWCKADFHHGQISQSLYEQSEFLCRNLETYLGGNHLLENARALIFAGRFFDGDLRARNWLRKGLSLYEKETAKQILPDGWHYERSPMYHALMLEAYLDVLNLAPQSDRQNSFLADAARKMLDSLVSATRPDGQIVLFNDATEEIAPPTARLVEYGRSLLGYEPQRRESFPDAGYYTYRDDSLFIFIDGGPIGPNELPAHAHADIFSYELCLFGLPLIVDTGVYEYQVGGMRDHVRHTHAHNTICVDGVSQAECWKSFRVARRYPPKDVSYEAIGETRVFRGRFDGYSYLIGDRIQHERTIVIDSGKRCISVDDSIHGHGAHLIESRLHLHPEVKAEVSNSTARLKRDGVEANIRIADGHLHAESGWYCPRMGTKIPNTVLVIKNRSELPVRLRYQIHY